MMKSLKTFTAALLCALLPGWSLYAAVPDMPIAFNPAFFKIEEPVETFVGWEQIVMEDSTPAVVAPEIVSALFPEADDAIPQITEASVSMEDLSSAELEEKLQDELIIEGEESEGKGSRKLRIIGGLLLLGGGIAALLMLLSGGGSGGGSGSGSGDGGGNGGTTNSNNIPPVGGGGGAGGGGTGGGSTGGGGAGGAGGSGGNITPFTFTPFNPASIPNNPEPSSLLLIGLGLLLPFFRRKG